MERSSDDLIHLSLDLSRLFRRTMECEAGDANFLQLRALSIIADHKRLAMTEFARAMSISRSTATEFADRLMHSGFILRLMEPENRRTVLIALTPLGQEIVERGMRRKKRLLGKLFAGLSVADRAHLERILHLLLQSIQA